MPEMPERKPCSKCGGSNQYLNKGGDGHLSWRCRDCKYGKTSAAPKRKVEKLDVVEEHRLRQECRELRVKLEDAVARLVTVKDVADMLAKARETKIDPIKPRERQQGKKSEATAMAIASDWHVEQRVDPAEVNDDNEFDLAIAERRMERFFEKTRYCIDFNRQIFTVRDLVLPGLGDFITNYLRDENQQTNLLTPTRGIAFWKTNFKAGIKHLLKDPELERIAIPLMDGNHPRTTKKVQASNRAGMNLETLMYLQLAEEFADEPRVQFQIATGSLMYFDVYGRTIRALHGDIVNYHGGVGGITIPLLRALGRWQQTRYAHLTILGHFHQLIDLPNMIVNGSLIGYDAFAQSNGFALEPPAQAFCMLDPERFKSVFMPMWVGESLKKRPVRRVERHG